MDAIAALVFGTVIALNLRGLGLTEAHVIRTEANYLRIWQYIDENPACWAEDEYYSE